MRATTWLILAALPSLLAGCTSVEKAFDGIAKAVEPVYQPVKAVLEVPSQFLAGTPPVDPDELYAEMRYIAEVRPSGSRPDLPYELLDPDRDRLDIDGLRRRGGRSDAPDDYQFRRRR